MLTTVFYVLGKVFYIQFNFIWRWIMPDTKNSAKLWVNRQLKDFLGIHISSFKNTDGHSNIKRIKEESLPCIFLPSQYKISYAFGLF